MLPVSESFPLQSDSSPSLISKERARPSLTTQTTSEGAFLDFLYPAPALAWMSAANVQQRERRQRLNAKRMPERVVQATRGYSSGSHVQLSALPDAQGGDDISQDSTAKSIGEAVPSTGRTLADDAEVEESAEDRSDSMQQISLSLDMEEQPGDDNEFAQSPADPAQSSDPPLDDEATSDPLRYLRRLLSGMKPPRGEDGTLRSWKLYNCLDEDDRRDPLLKNEFLQWLVTQDNTVANAHGISLYWSLPLSERRLPTYQAALKAFIRRKDLDSAVGLHKEALNNIDNGGQITKELFRYALRETLLETALLVQTQHHDHFSGPGQTHQLALFWLNVADMPDLMDVTSSTVKKLGWWKKRSKKTVDQYFPLALRLCHEALDRLMQGYLSKVYSRGSEASEKLYLVVEFICKHDGNAAAFMEKSLMSLLQKHVHSQFYSRVHHIASCMYLEARKAGHFQPSEGLLSLLLARVVRYRDSLRRHERGTRNLTTARIVSDSKRLHGKLSRPALHDLMSYHASQGEKQKVRRYFDVLKEQYPDYDQYEEILWTLVYVHGRVADSRSAKAAFEEVEQIAKEHNRSPDVKCFNVLLYAQCRTNDVRGAIVTMSNIAAAGLKPNVHSFGPILDALAREGDIRGIQNMLEQYDSLTASPRVTDFVRSQLTALVKNDKLTEAWELLGDSVERLRRGELLGSLTGCFNIMITSYATRRDVDSMMRVYSWMRQEGIRRDGDTYSGLMKALTRYRQTNAARQVMAYVMKADKLKPTALHYAILMTGFMQQDEPKEVLRVNAEMLERNIRPTTTTEMLYLKAKALYEQRARQRAGSLGGADGALEDVLAELRKAFAGRKASSLASKSNLLGSDPTASSGVAVAASAYLADAMKLHGRRKRLDAVRSLLEQFRKEMLRQGQDTGDIPMPILSAVMEALYHAREYVEVERYWKVAKTQADKFASSSGIMEMADSLRSTVQVPEVSRTTVASPDSPPKEDARAEIGFAAASDGAVDVVSEPPPQASSSLISRPVPGRKYILTEPLRYYLKSLFWQDRCGDMITTFTNLLRQGYTFDMITWNRYIELLCVSSPPLALLAFTLTERFLISNFPGWSDRGLNWPPKKSSRAENLQHLRARYVNLYVLMPQYRTMIWLARALLRLKRAETGEGRDWKREAGGLHRLIGSSSQIEQRAPKTFAAVQDMPRIDEKWQSRALDLE